MSSFTKIHEILCELLRRSERLMGRQTRNIFPSLVEVATIITFLFMFKEWAHDTIYVTSSSVIHPVHCPKAHFLQSMNYIV